MDEEQLTIKLYNEEAEREWKRLAKDQFHKLEFNTTLHFLKKYLPKKGFILDAGGGPGRYTIELAKMGYKVALLDLAPGNLEVARKKIKDSKVKENVISVEEGSIINLSRFKSNSFDAVLCLGGPISHVAKEKDRKKAASELIRVAKKSAPILISVMGKNGALMNALRRWPEEVRMKKHFEEFSIKGNDYMWHGGRGYAHFFTLSELVSLVGNKTTVLEEVGLEGLATPQQDVFEKFAKKKKLMKNWMKTHYALCTNPTIADSSLHMLLVARKK